MALLNEDGMILRWDTGTMTDDEVYYNGLDDIISHELIHMKYEKNEECDGCTGCIICQIPRLGLVGLYKTSGHILFMYDDHILILDQHENIHKVDFDTTNIRIKLPHENISLYLNNLYIYSAGIVSIFTNYKLVKEIKLKEHKYFLHFSGNNAHVIDYFNHCCLIDLEDGSLVRSELLKECIHDTYSTYEMSDCVIIIYKDAFITTTSHSKVEKIINIIGNIILMLDNGYGQTYGHIVYGRIEKIEFPIIPYIDSKNKVNIKSARKV